METETKRRKSLEARMKKRGLIFKRFFKSHYAVIDPATGKTFHGLITWEGVILNQKWDAYKRQHLDASVYTKQLISGIQSADVWIRLNK